MQGATVGCVQNIPEGDAGEMEVTGTVDGQEHQLQLWSTGPAPGKPQYIEVWNGTPAKGDIAYRGDGVTGISGFDWSRGVTLDVDLGPFSSPGGGTLHVSGTLVCPPPPPSPTPVPARPEPVLAGPTDITLSGAISGVLQNPRTICQTSYMAAFGTIGSRPVAVTIWGTGGTGAGRPNEMYEGAQAGEIDYAQDGAAGPTDLSGITGYDQARGATFSIDLPDVTWVGRQSAAPSPALPGIHVSGRITC